VFRFDQRDLEADFYTAAALAQVDYNLTALLNVTTLTEVSKKVFQTFFQAFIALDNGDNEYWAYERIEKKLQEDLDFLTQIAITKTSTYTSRENYCHDSAATSCFWTARDLTTMTWTETYTTYPTYSTSLSTSTPTTFSLLHPLTARAISTATAPPSIAAIVSVEVPLLKLSKLAVWFSLSLIVVLIATAVLAFFQQRNNSKLLPRNLESPASAMALVHASTNIQAWAKQMHDNGRWDEHSGTGLRIRRAREYGAVAMGPFGQNWGVEITPQRQHAAVDQSNP
jgi:hypothetical protein